MLGYPAAFVFLGCWLLFMNYFIGQNTERANKVATHIIFFGALFTFVINVVF
jgi:hypothetical protein